MTSLPRRERTALRSAHCGRKSTASGLAYNACHVIHHTSNPHFMSDIASYDVANNDARPYHRFGRWLALSHATTLNISITRRCGRLATTYPHTTDPGVTRAYAA